MKRNDQLLVLCVCVVLAAPAFGQVSSASLTGLVKDSSDALVTEAKVTARQVDTGINRSSASNSSGYYFFANLPVGSYEISVEKPGFQKAVSTLTLDAGEKGRQDFTLIVGTVSTVTTVEAAAPILSPDDASLGSVVGNKYVSQYPLLLRSWDDLVSTLAGVQGQRYTDQGASTAFGRTGGFNVHGIRSLQNNYMMDGIDNNSISENVQELTTQVARPSVDTIQEFKVTTNPYSAEYGRAGAVVSVITKGGTNQIHGVAYEYLRNRDTDANDFFSNAHGLAKPTNIRNQFGGNFGGPVRKNKLFFFADEETTRIETGTLRSTTVPTPNERIGDFSAAAGALVNFKYPTLYQNGAPIPLNMIPSGDISHVATAVMNLFPQPTVPGAEQNNYFRNALLTDNVNRLSSRVDWQASEHDSIFGRYTWSGRERVTPGNFPGIADGTQSSSGGDQHLTADQAALGWTKTLTPTLVNELRIGYEHDNSSGTQIPFGQSGGNLVPGIPNNPVFAGGVTMITFANFNTFIGSPNFLPKFQKTQQWQFSDSISMTRGSHQFKFGADVHAPQVNNFLDVPGLRGALNFDRIFTCQRNANNQCVAGTGLSYADFLYGDPQTAMQSNLANVNQKWYWFDFFVQDDFKVTPKLTLNLGLRYDFSSPVWEGNNHLSNFNPAGAGSIVTASSGSLSNRTLVNPQKRDFAPRVGLAYQLDTKTVLRGGYGVFFNVFDRIGSEDQLAENPPYLLNVNVSLPSTALAPVFPLDGGFPSNFLDPNNINYKTLHLRATNPNDPRTYIQQWSFGVQRELARNLLLELDYVGTKGTHLNALSDLNQFVNNGSQVTLNAQGQPMLPYPNFALIEYKQANAYSNYQGLDLTLERRFAMGMTFRLAYTWSRSIDDDPEHLTVYGSNSFSQIGSNQNSWRGPSDFDTPQRIVLAGVYELPFGKGKQFAQNGWASAIFGGFQLSGSYTRRSGLPFTAFASSNNSSIDIGEQNALPNVIGTPTMIENVNCWYYMPNTPGCKSFTGATAFSIPSPGVFGNAGRNIMRGPGLTDLDLAVARNFRIKERVALQFRAESFNLSNTVGFGLPNSNVSGGTAGTITSLSADPRIMQFALRLSF